LIPDDMEFQSGDMPNYTTSDGSVRIIYYFPNGKEESKLFYILCLLSCLIWWLWVMFLF